MLIRRHNKYTEKADTQPMLYAVQIGQHPKVEAIYLHHSRVEDYKKYVLGMFKYQVGWG